MKKAAILFIFETPLLFVLSSCSIIKKNYEIDVEQLYVGAVGSVNDNYGTAYTNYLHLEIEKEKTVKSLSVDLHNCPDLELLGKNSYDSEGNLIKYFNISDYMKNELQINSLSSFLNDDQCNLRVFFSLGDLNNSETDFVSQKTTIKESGIYCFSTLTENNELLTYSHAYIIKEKIEWGL